MIPMSIGAGFLIPMSIGLFVSGILIGVLTDISLSVSRHPKGEQSAPPKDTGRLMADRQRATPPVTATR